MGCCVKKKKHVTDQIPQLVILIGQQGGWQYWSSVYLYLDDSFWNVFSLGKLFESKHLAVFVKQVSGIAALLWNFLNKFRQLGFS